MAAEKKETADPTEAGAGDTTATPKRAISFGGAVTKVTKVDSSVTSLRSHILGGGSGAKRTPKSSSWRVAMLLKDPWIRDQYKRREGEIKGSGSAFLRHVAKPGMLAKEKEKDERQKQAQGDALAASAGVGGGSGGDNGNDSIVVNLTDGVKRLVTAANKKREDGDASDSVSDTEKRVNTSLEKISDNNPDRKSKDGRGCCGGRDDDNGGICAVM